MEESTNSSRKGLRSLTPQAAFKLGLGTALAIMFTIGFFILLGIMLSDGDNSSAKKSPSEKNIATSPTGNAGGSKINIEPITDDDWVKGDRDAKISIIEFSDLECPFCKRFHPTMNQIVSDYDGDVNWVYRHFPLAQLHSKAAREAEATECAGEQGGNDAFWAYTDRLFEITPSNNKLEDSQLPQIAADVGLNVGKFQKCLDSGKYADKVSDHVRQATTAGGRGTPYSVIIAGDQRIPINGALPIETIKAQLDSILN